MKKALWNDNWKFWPEGDAFALVWKSNPNAETVTLPHDAMILNKPHAESPNKGNTGYRDGDVYHYSKEIYASEEMKEQTAMLHFEGVYSNAQVYVNSEMVLSHNYGYTGFYVPLNNYLKWGQTNEIRVIVRNSGMPNSRWYSGSGIYRDVYLLTGGGIYFEPDASNVITEDASTSVSTIKVKGTIVSRKMNREALSVSVKVKNSDGAEVAKEVFPLAIFGNTKEDYQIRFAIENAKLWTAESPYLYTLVSELLDADGNVLDSEECTFGIRKLLLDAKRGFLVNGAPVNLAGACIHHDNGFVGAATYYDFHYRQVEKLKECGFNAIRMSHHPAAPALLRACDELGMYVMDEAFDMWTRSKTANDYAINFEKNWESDVEAMVRKDFNHPCVVLYSIGNEIPEIGTENGARLARMISNKIRSLDETRYVLSSINGTFAVGHVIGDIMKDILARYPDEVEVGGDANVNEMMATMRHMDEVQKHPLMDHAIEEAGGATDIIGYNYMNRLYERDLKKYANRIIVGSETTPNEVRENWDMVKEYPNLIGDFVWTGWEYIGESGIAVPQYNCPPGDGFGTPYPCIMSYTGDIDLTGFKKPVAYLASVIFGARKAPYVCAQHPMHFNDSLTMTPWLLTDALEDWTYPGYEGKPVKVEVYSAGDEVELLLNGKSLGRKPAGKSVRYITNFEVNYEAGELVAVSYENGVESGRASIQTMKEAKLTFTVENGKTNQLAYVSIEMKDECGVISYASQDEVTVEAVSNAKVFAGSGNPFSEDSYSDGKTSLFRGRAQAVVVKERSGEKAVIRVNGNEVEC